MNIVLVEPEIPPNTGNVARLCAATRATLHLVGPLGFRLDDRQLKRAGMDYWEHVIWKSWSSWDELRAQIPTTSQVFLVENITDRLYTSVRYQADDYLVFGRETTGLPDSLLDRYPDTTIAIPQFNPKARSLNLSNCVAIVLYEALRQIKGF